MQEFDKIGEDLFNKIRGRFPEVTIGDETGTVTNEPEQARFFDFDYNGLGKVSVSISEDEGLTIIYSKDFMEDQDEMTQDAWYNFLRELRVFSKKRMMDYSVRDITKSNLNKRDYKFLAKTPEDGQMTESKLYGTSKISYQNVGEARIMIKHTESVNQESASGRTRSIGKIYIESADGERFMYPFKHLSGARAMARHVAEGGKPFDDFGTHITGLSEEMSKLRKFKNYMGRSAVMAESLAGYVDVVKERISTVKKTIESLQKPNFYAEAVAAFETPIMEDVPADVAENWIDQLTIKQFNEELADVFPYIYKLVGEATRVKTLGPDDLDEAGNRPVDRQFPIGTGDTRTAKELKTQMRGASDEFVSSTASEKTKPFSSRVAKMQSKLAKSELRRRTNKTSKEEFELEQGFEEMMGQFSDHVCEDCGNPSYTTLPEEKQKGVDGKVCWKGYKRMGTKMKGGKRVDNCVKVGEDDTMDVKINSKGQLSKADGTEEKEQKTPLGEFILSYFDKETGAFPKGETAVLTMIEKDYGEQFIEPAKAFIEQIGAKFEEFQMRTQPQQMEAPDDEDQMSLNLQGGSGKPPRETDNYDRYRMQQLQKKFAADQEKAEAFEPGQRVRVNVRRSEPFARQDRYSVWHPTKIFPQGGHVTGTVVKPGTLGGVVVKLDNPVKYRETIRGKRVTTTLDQTEFGYRLLKPLDGEKESQDLDRISELAGLR